MPGKIREILRKTNFPPKKSSFFLISIVIGQTPAVPMSALLWRHIKLRHRAHLQAVIRRGGETPAERIPLRRPTIPASFQPTELRNQLSKASDCWRVEVKTSIRTVKLFT